MACVLQNDMIRFIFTRGVYFLMGWKIMAFEEYFEEFSSDVQDFFANVTTFEEAYARAEEHKYGFLARNQKLIQKRYDLIYEQLKKEQLKKDKINRDAFWFYCYYCCIMLQNCHRFYGQEEEAKKLIKVRVQIKQRALKDEQSNHDSFIAYLGKKFSDALIDLLKAPTRVSKTRDYVAAGNLERIYWYFCRTTITKSFLLARELQWLDRLGSALGRSIDADRIISILERPNPTLRVLSVGFFAFRFILNGAMLIKHTYGSKEEREDESYDWWMRLKGELYKRHPSMVNDIVWGTVNFITNYNSLVGIPDPTAGWIVAGFLFFDFAWLVYHRYLEEQEYRAQKSQLEREWCQAKDELTSCLEQLKNEDLKKEERDRLHARCEFLSAHIASLKKQSDQLDISWGALSSTFWFNSAAALLLAAGFTASMVLTAPVMVLACYAICTFAVAMYLSADAFKKYQEKNLQFEYANIHKDEMTPVEMAKVMKDYYQARNEFILTMAKNVLMPTLFIVTFAVCWEAALVLTAAYIGYQLYNAYTKYTETKENNENQGLTPSPSCV